ncbi:hydantoinase [Pueribacillus theae]|uniref:Hydantoinase n=1 Tax=Pueribacillus theae TaxID=2171751 RepID=A0A2U1JVQ4_9BACI|nr:hydantoinase B/oxoprolinase family protein [Pueribacillus theae]PWA09222.1 hydantoinase [Pueribacillus theae]
MKNFDPVTLEVLRMRLNNIVEEMGIAMIRSSGSPVITEAGDFNTAIFDKEGRVLAYSDYVQFHIGSGSIAIQNLLKAITLTDVNPGDAFISNDPHTSGSTHPPDVTLLSPIFYDGEIIAWAQSQAHLMDVGGMTPGGFAPQAVDCFSEAIRMPPGTKIYENGRPIEFVKNMILNNLRLPVLFWNDVRSLVAANNTGIKRLTATINEVGNQKFWDYTQKSIELAEEVVRKRIESIQEDVYEAEEWTENNGHVDELYRIHCRMEVKGDEITLDFSQSSKQTDGFVNCSFGATLGSVASAIMPVLAWDIPFNYGVMMPFTIHAEEGTIVNPVVPAPVSNGHLTTGGKVTRVMIKVLNQACAKSSDEVLNRRTQGQWSDSWTGGITAGSSDKGDYFVLFNMDGGGMGAGAQYNGDGLDSSGMMTQVNNVLPDVESNEMMYPVLYLWKKLDPKSAGPGYFRGGLGLDFAWTLWGCEEAVQTVFSPTSQVPAEGYGGGYPGGSSQHIIKRETNVNELFKSGQVPDANSLISQEDELLAINDNSYVKVGDVFVQNNAGGGGFGDPLLRPLYKVEYDVLSGYVTPEIARFAYGIVFVEKTLEIDKDKSEANRRNLRAERINVPVSEVKEVRLDSRDSEQSIGTLKRSDGTYECKYCCTHLGSYEFECAEKVTSNIADKLGQFGVRVRRRETKPSISLIEQFCPGCGTAVRATIKVG